MDGSIRKASTYGNNWDELIMPPDFLKLLLQISCSHSDKDVLSFRFCI